MKDFMREAVFAMLGSRVVGAQVLDLFAGSGSLGLEALSRGAVHAVFVDRGKEATRVIRENLDKLGMGGRGTVIQCDVLDYLRKNRFPTRAFDLIFIDPPYKIDVDYREEILKRLAWEGFLNPCAVLIMQAPLRSSVPEAPPGLRVRERRRYGEAAVDVYVREENIVK